jgi:hypothetical protein
MLPLAMVLILRASTGDSLLPTLATICYQSGWRGGTKWGTAEIGIAGVRDRRAAKSDGTRSHRPRRREVSPK